MAADARQSSTARSYGRHWAAFAEWCALNSLEPLPATPDMVAAYIGSIADRGTVAARSLQPYLSAINSVHADFGYERPALGHFITTVRRGMARTQAATATRDTRIPLPAPAVEAVLDDTLARLTSHRPDLHPRPWAVFLRARFSFLLAFLFMGRQDSTTLLRREDFGLSDSHMRLRLWEKQRKHSGERRIVRIPRSPPPSHGFPSRVPDVARVGLAYAQAVLDLTASPPPFFFQLPGEAPPTTRSMSAWVSSTLASVDIAAPPGFAYLGHSLRSGASSAAEAIKVPRARGDWLGGWAPGSFTRDKHYIDPTVEPSPAAYRLLGWLLDSEYVVLHAPALTSSLSLVPSSSALRARGGGWHTHTSPESLGRGECAVSQ